MHVKFATEGKLDEAVARRLIEHVGGNPGESYGMKGKAKLLQSLRGYNESARHGTRWLVLVDLDSQSCAPVLANEWLPSIQEGMCFRVVVREIEAWLMSDPEALARHIGVSPVKVPHAPESLDDPKQSLVNLARRSRRRTIMDDMVPRQGSGRQVGRAYSSTLIEFVEDGWRPQVAAERSESLRRALACLKRLMDSDSA